MSKDKFYQFLYDYFTAQLAYAKMGELGISGMLI